MFYQLHDWVPDPTDPFYRPISRGIFFTTLDLAGPFGAVLGHLLNLCFLTGIILLLGTLTARLAGRKASLLAGLLLAGLGATTTLVGWICCDQDLLAMLFVALALNLRFQRRNGAAFAAVAAALLSKETTLAVIPTLVLFDWILGRKPYRIGRTAGVYAVLVAVWGAIHPAVRTLVARGLRGGATGYVGLEDPENWPVYLGRYLLTLFNLPAFFPLPGWPVFGVLLLVATLVLVVAALRVAGQAPDSNETVIPPSRVVLLGALLAAGPLIMTSTMVQYWSMYYAAFPAFGLSMIGGVLLSSLPFRTQAIAIAVYFTLGMWTRGPTRKPTDSTESNFRRISEALQEIHMGFRRLYPVFPSGAQVLLSVQTRSPGVYMHMYTFQVLRIWYRDRSTHTLRPEARRADSLPQLLMVITPDRDVIDINLSTLFARSASGREPEYKTCEGAIRAYAMGLAGSGDTDTAVNLLLHMPEVSAGLKSVHLRMAAMFLFAQGRDREAEAILDSTAALPRGVAFADLHAVLAEQPPGRVLDEYALRAFDVSPDDSAAVRDLMRRFEAMKYAGPALRFAERMERLKPGDREAAVVASKMRSLLKPTGKGPPVAGDVD